MLHYPWKLQVATVYNKGSRNMALIRHNRKYISLELCQKLALGLVMAILDYDNSLYFGLSNKELNKFQRLQNYASIKS